MAESQQGLDSDCLTELKCKNEAHKRQKQGWQKHRDIAQVCKYRDRKVQTQMELKLARNAKDKN